MLRPEYPEVLARDWQPPVLVGRVDALEELRRALDQPPPRGSATRSAGVIGPPGCGSSAVARRAAQAVVDRLRSEEVGPGPHAMAVRVAWHSGALAVAAELLRHFDPGFEPRGFTVAEVMAGFVRRLVREGRPAVIVLDDLRPDGPDLNMLLKALVNPVRFLPEGINSPPRIWLVLAGSSEAVSAWARARRAGIPPSRTIRIEACDPREIEAIVRDRAQRSLGRVPPEPWTSDLVAAVVGTTATRAIDRLRRELAEVATIGLAAGPGSPRPSEAVAVEPRLLLALQLGLARGPAPLHELRDRERRLAEADGDRPMPTTTFWRRIVRMESLGLIRREVRTGGPGGTLSLVEFARPPSEWLEATVESPRAAAAVGPAWLRPREAPAAPPLGLAPASAAPAARLSAAARAA
jgi:hypothetical protein